MGMGAQTAQFAEPEQFLAMLCQELEVVVESDSYLWEGKLRTLSNALRHQYVVQLGLVQVIASDGRPETRVFILIGHWLLTVTFPAKLLVFWE